MYFPFHIGVHGKSKIIQCQERKHYALIGPHGIKKKISLLHTKAKSYGSIRYGQKMVDSNTCIYKLTITGLRHRNAISV